MLDSVTSLARYQAQGEGDLLYVELKKEVDAYFRENKVRPVGPRPFCSSAFSYVTHSCVAAGSQILHVTVCKDSCDPFGGHA